jgi:hypothetical protein
VDVDDWSAANPARGQCGTTALTIKDLLGGELLVAEVLRADGSRQGSTGGIAFRTEPRLT